MTNAQLDHLIRMANQIADNNTHHDTESEAVEMVTTHLKKFWARAMKQQIVEYALNDGQALNPVAKQAIDQLALYYAPASK